MDLKAPHPHFDAHVRKPAIDFAPPVSPNAPRAPEVQKIHSNFLETLIFNGLASPLALVLVVMQGRYLHTSGRGSFVLVVLSVTILTRLLGQLGYAVTNRSHEHGSDLKSLIQSSFAIAVVLGLTGTAIVIAWGVAVGDAGTSVVIFAALGLIPNVVWQCVCGVLLGLGQVRLWNIIQTLPSVLIVIGFAIFVIGLDLGVEGAILAWTFTHLLTAVFALVASRKIWRPLPIDGFLELFSRQLAWFALTMGAVQVVNLLSYRIELIVLEKSKGLAQVGIYSIAVQTGEMVWLIAGALTTAVTAPALADDEKGAVGIISRTAAKALVYSAVIGAAMAAFVPYAFGPVLGSSFEAAKTPLRLLLPGQVIYAPVTILVVYLSVRRGRPGMSLAVSTAGLVVTFVASLILIPRYGASGAAASSAIGYAAGALLAWSLFTKLARTPETHPAAAPAPAAAEPGG